MTPYKFFFITEYDFFVFLYLFTLCSVIVFLIVSLRNYSKFNSLVDLKCHYHVYHCGEQAPLCNMQNNYWIIRGLQKVKSILKKCVVCKIVQRKTLAPPETPALTS